MKRGSEDYSDRRASHDDHETSTAFGGWFNKTFKGAGGPQGAQGQQAPQGGQDERRGVME